MSEESLAQALMAKHDQNEPSEQENGSSTITDSTSTNVTTPPTSSSSTSSAVANGISNSSSSANGKYDLTSLESFPSLGAPKKPASPALSSSSGGAWGSSTATTVSTPANPAAGRTVSTVKSSTVSEILRLPLSLQQKKSSQFWPAFHAKWRKVGVTIESSTSKAAATTTFIVKGSAQNVQKAKRDIQKELALKTSKTILVPVSLKAAIIGPKGSNLKPIIEKSGCAIQVAKQTPDEIKARDGGNTKGQGDDDDDEEELVDVVIEGDIEGIQVAEQEIFAIVKSKKRDLTSKLQVDDKLKPFVEKEFKFDGLKVVKTDNGFTFSGERELVLETKSKVESFVKNSTQSFATSTVAIPATKQRFLNAKETFDTTGVAVFFDEKTPSSDSITIYGPTHSLKSARDFLTKKAGSLNVLTLDIARAHDKTISHAENIALYLNNKNNQIRQIEQDSNVQLKFPEFFTGKDVIVEIVGTDVEQIKSAKKNLVALVNSLPPSHVKRIDDVDDFFKAQVSRLSKKLQTEYYVRVVMSDPIVFVYEGNPKQDEEDFAPGASEIQETLSKANAELDDIRSKQADIVEKKLSIPADEQKYIAGPKNTTLNALIGDGLVTITLGSSTSGSDKNSVIIRGLKNEVERISKEINQVIDEGKNYEELSKYTTDFNFPADHVNKLIGRQGSNLAKICEEFGVNVDIDENGRGTIRGIKKNADEAKLRILNQGKRFADEVTETLHIPNERHPTLIGRGGKFVERLRERYDVRIKFPEIDSTGQQQKKDEVVLRGPSRSVAKVKEELLDLLKYEEEHSFTQTIKVPSKALPRVIGRQGGHISNIKDQTETTIDVAHEETDKNDGDKEVSITIVGTKSGVKEAIDAIQEMVTSVVNTVTETVEVDPKYHKSLIGPGGSTRRDIIAKACGDEAMINQKMITVPPSGSGDSTVTVTGNKKYVAKAVKKINELVAEQASKVEVVVDVPQDRRGALIGAGGMVKQELESTFNISMFVPKQGSTNTGVTIVGTPENAEKAKARIQELTASKYKVELTVPAYLHAALSDRGSLSRRLKSEFDVKVDHGGGNLPKAKDSTKAPSKDCIGEVLITEDENEAAKKFKWTVVSDGESEAKRKQTSNTIPWRLIGEDDNCAKAKEVIEKALEQVRKHDSTGYLWLADPSRYKLVVGPSGSRISYIRTESGCSVNVPNNSGKEDEVIVIRGSSSQLEKAKDMILESIKR